MQYVYKSKYEILCAPNDNPNNTELKSKGFLNLVLFSMLVMDYAKLIDRINIGSSCNYFDSKCGLAGYLCGHCVL